MVSTSIYAQIPINSGWSLGIDVGGAFNRMSTKDLTLKKGRWGMTAGLTASYTFKNNLSCETGIRYTNKACDELRGTLNDGKYTFTSYKRADGGFLVGVDLNISQAVCRITYGRSFCPISNPYDSGSRQQTLSLSVGYYLFRNNSLRKQIDRFLRLTKHFLCSKEQ